MLPRATLPSTPASVVVPIARISIRPVSVPELLTLNALRCLLAVPPMTPANSTSPDPERIVRLLGVLSAAALMVVVVPLNVTLPLFELEFVSIVTFSESNTGPVMVTSPLTATDAPPAASLLSVAVVISPVSVVDVVDVNATSLISPLIAPILIVPLPAVMVTSVASFPSPAVFLISTPTAIFPAAPEPVSIVRFARSPVTRSPEPAFVNVMF